MKANYLLDEEELGEYHMIPPVCQRTTTQPLSQMLSSARNQAKGPRRAQSPPRNVRLFLRLPTFSSPPIVMHRYSRTYSHTTRIAANPPDPASPQPLPQPGAPQPPPPHQQYISPDAMFPVYNVNPSVAASFGIPAEAANLEYSILSAILGGSPDSGSGGSPGIAHAVIPQPGPSPVSGAGPSSYNPAQTSGLSAASWPSEPIHGQYVPGQPGAPPGYAPAGAHQYGEQPQMTIQAASVAGGVPPEYIAPGAPGYPQAYAAQSGQGGPSQYAEYDRSQAQPPQGQVPPQGAVGGAPYPSPSPQSFLVRPRRQMSMASPTGSKWNGVSNLGIGGSGSEGAVQSVYRNVTKGYDYMEGYHFLMKHMTRRCVASSYSFRRGMTLTCAFPFLFFAIDPTFCTNCVHDGDSGFWWICQPSRVGVCCAPGSPLRGGIWSFAHPITSSCPPRATSRTTDGSYPCQP